ncbi:MAG TPA: BsuPI-related putative proteinase inhibitor [Halococcus sp.]|nr:BsuPI-related putative proteinase inhibitor [Halococcus sp.]
MALTGTLDIQIENNQVSFVFTIENEGDEPVTLSFRDAHTADFAVFDGEDERWRWSTGRMFAQMLQSEELTSDESVTYEGEWENPKSGSYTGVATLEAENHDCEARTGFSV